MKTKLCIGAVVLTAWLGAAFADDPVESLLKVKSFAFGGIGIAGTISPGEVSFRGILDRPDALALFRTVLAKGSAEAALYALCGIRALDRAAFEAAADPLRKRNPEVETIGGCMISHQKAAGVIKNIADGQYDRYWNKK